MTFNPSVTKGVPMTEASARRTILKTISALMLLTNCGNAAASEVEDAVEFMFTGDKGWGDSYSNVIALKDCKTSYTEPSTYLDNGKWKEAKADVLLDWNNVIWNSARYEAIEYMNLKGAFTFDCKGVCRTEKIKSGSQTERYYIQEKSEQQIKLPVFTAQERVENALRVLASECPGVGTRF